MRGRIRTSSIPTSSLIVKAFPCKGGSRNDKMQSLVVIGEYCEAIYALDIGSKSLNRAELHRAQWPMQKGTYTLTSGFGPRWGTHYTGLDFGAPDGTPF